MMRKIALLILIGLFILPGGNRLEAQALRIAAASNLQYAIKDLTRLWKMKTSKEVEVILASSGQLFAQIEAGAPYDVFLSADWIFPERLHEEGLTESPPEPYALGTLIFWSKEANYNPDKSISSGKRLCIADTSSAPYGRAAAQYLEARNAWPTKSLVFGESISQVNQYIFLGEVDAAFTTLAVIRAQGSMNGYWCVVDDIYDPIRQGAVVLRNSRDPLAARDFLEFLHSTVAQNVLHEFGYK